jgi:cell division protein ZipA
MQELRLVLIIVGGLAILALLIHGLWSSKKESKSKFSTRAADADSDQLAEPFVAPEDDYEIIRKDKNAPSFGATRTFDDDPLADPLDSDERFEAPFDEDVELPSVRLDGDVADELVDSETADDLAPFAEPESPSEPDPIATEPEQPEPEMEVIVLNVHCSGEEPFVGTRLFDSMEQNGLKYGEMDIFHRHSDLSGSGKVLFSVANMMHPGTLAHDDPATFTTKGISFFMTLPCYGPADQNFKLMLKTAQQIADDMGGNVLDDQRNLITPDRLSQYRDQIRDFKLRSEQNS